MNFNIKKLFIFFPLLISGCVSISVLEPELPIKQPVLFGVDNMYLHHLDVEPEAFHRVSKAAFKSFLNQYQLAFTDDHFSKKQSTLSTQAIEISEKDLVKYGFVDQDFSKGRLVAVARSIKHPFTQKSIVGLSFYLHGWDGENWVAVESNRMNEQRIYNILSEVVANANQNFKENQQ